MFKFVNVHVLCIVEDSAEMCAIKSALSAAKLLSFKAGLEKRRFFEEKVYTLLGFLVFK